MRAQLIQLIQMVRSFLRKTFHAENPELPYYITLTIALILFVIAMNGFVYLTEELIEDNLTEYDKAASDFVNDNRTRGLTLFFPLSHALRRPCSLYSFYCCLCHYLLCKETELEVGITVGVGIAP